MSAENPVLAILSLLVFIAIPVILINSASYFSAGEEIFDDPPTYNTTLTNFQQEISVQWGGFPILGSFAAVAVNSLINVVDFVVGWMLEPFVDFMFKYFYVFAVSSTVFGINSTILWLIMGVFLIYPMMYIIRIIIDAIGAVIP